MPASAFYANQRNRVQMGVAMRHDTDMTEETVTFGKAIAKARKAKGMSQKELAAIIVKDDGSGGNISPQYLNDIEHDRRSPSSDHIIREFAKAIDIDENMLFLLAGKIPDEVRRRLLNSQKVETATMAFMSFRKSV